MYLGIKALGDITSFDMRALSKKLREEGRIKALQNEKLQKANLAKGTNTRIVKIQCHVTVSYVITRF